MGFSNTEIAYINGFQLYKYISFRMAEQRVENKRETVVIQKISSIVALGNHRLSCIPEQNCGQHSVGESTCRLYVRDYGVQTQTISAWCISCNAMSNAVRNRRFIIQDREQITSLFYKHWARKEEMFHVFFNVTTCTMWMIDNM